MFLTDFDSPVTSQDIIRLYKKHFGSSLPFETLTPKMAEAVLSSLSEKIAEVRRTEKYFLGENNAEYLRMLTAARFLTSYLTEAPPIPKNAKRPVRNAAAYHHGTAKAISHGIDTGAKIIPHVAGSAAGAFLAGLKGNALHSDAGRVHIAKHDVDKDLGMIDPKKPQTIDEFAKKQAKDHFGQYDPKAQAAIAAYIKQMMKDGLENKRHTAQDINANLAKIAGNPLGNVTDPNKKTELVNYFAGVNSGGASIRTQAAGGAKRIEPSVDKLRIESDVISALMNQGYKKNDAGRAVQMASGLAGNDNFDSLFKSTMALLKKAPAPTPKR